MKLCIIVARHVFPTHQTAVKQRQPGPVINKTNAELDNIQALSPAVVRA
jgi:hypothetical protein